MPSVLASSICNFVYATRASIPCVLTKYWPVRGNGATYRPGRSLVEVADRLCQQAVMKQERHEYSTLSDVEDKCCKTDLFFERSYNHYTP